MNAPKWPEKWADKTWKVQGEKLTEADLAAFYAAIPHGKLTMCRALEVPGLQHRKADRALKLLRDEKLIWFNPDTKLWEQSGACPVCNGEGYIKIKDIEDENTHLCSTCGGRG